MKLSIISILPFDIRTKLTYRKDVQLKVNNNNKTYIKNIY